MAGRIAVIHSETRELLESFHHEWCGALAKTQEERKVRMTEKEAKILGLKKCKRCCS